MMNGKLKLVELFSGIGAQATALENLGIPFESVCCEIDPSAYKAYCAIHGDTPNLGDITKVEHLPEQVDLLTYSFPCCPAGTMVATDEGYLPIEDVREGMKVLTHMNRFRTVNKTMTRIAGEGVYDISATGLPHLYLTGEHPLYVLRDGRFEWVHASDLKKSDMLTVNIRKRENELCDPPECVSEEGLCWMLGRYAADGFINPLHYNSVEFAIGVSKEQDFDAHICGRFSVMKKNKSHTTCWQYRIADKEFQDVCRQFGNGALNKRIPQWVFELSDEHLKEFFEGYMSGDGHIRKRGVGTEHMFSTVSHALFLGMQAIVARLYGVQCSCSIRHDSRSARYNDTYNAQFTVTDTKRTTQRIIEDKICIRINSIKKMDEDVQVYNMEVDEDNSYTCENIIVHNCQDLSIAGLQKGMTEGSGSRSSLLWEVGRLLEDAKERNDLPKYLVMENVDAILNSKNMPQFNKWIEKLTAMGYTSSYKVLNATDYGVPQSRRRCFMVSALNEGAFSFPEGRPLEKRLRDVLETDVPEEFYLSEERIAKYERTKNEQNALGRGFGWKPTTLDGIMSTIMTNPNTVIEPDIIRAGDLHQDGLIDQHNRVYSAEGISPTVCPPHGNGDAPKIEDKLIRAGTLDLPYDQDSRVYSAEGISPTLRVGGPPPSVEETGIILAGEISGSNFNGARRVLSVNGVAPTITCEHVGINHPKIEVIGDLNIDGKMESSNRVYDADGISPTIPAACGEGGGITPKIEIVPLKDDEDVAAMHTPGRAEKRQNGPRFKNDGTSFTLTTQDIDGIAKVEQGKLRIRYLTPRECWRLQGFDDARIDKAFEVIPAKTVRYRLAGNSIAVPCLEAIFKGIFVDRSFRVKVKSILEW